MTELIAKRIIYEYVLEVTALNTDHKNFSKLY